jgi:hypothetical protein
MGLVKAKVLAGACGFTSVVRVQKIEKMKVMVEIISACQDLRMLNQEMECIDCSHGVFGKMNESLIYVIASRKLKHPDCPVPCAIIKAIQVELGGAIPKDVVITFK